MKLTKDEIYIISGAYREIVLGIGIDKVDVGVGYTRDEIEKLVEKVEKNEEVTLPCKEIKLIRNLLADLLRELDAFEFSTRMGYEMNEVFDLFKKIKAEVDSVCYKKKENE